MTWVKKPKLVAEDTEVSVDKVGKAVEDIAVPHWYLCHTRHQKLEPVRTSKDTYSPLALATRARMEICSALS